MNLILIAGIWIKNLLRKFEKFLYKTYVFFHLKNLLGKLLCKMRILSGIESSYDHLNMGKSYVRWITKGEWERKLESNKRWSNLLKGGFLHERIKK